MSKKIIYCIFIIVFLGCKKDKHIEQKNEILLKVENGIVTFKSYEEYDTFLRNENSDKENQLIQLSKNENFTSYEKFKMSNINFNNTNSRNTNNLDTLDLDASSLITQIINSNGIIQIGVYFFKIDFVASKVYAAHQNNYSTAYTKLINNNATGTDVFEFSTSDDVIHILRANNNPTNENLDGESTTNIFKIRWPCFAEGGAPSKIDEEVFQTIVPAPFYPPLPYPVIYTPQCILICRVHYQKAGVYFSLLNKIIAKEYRYLLAPVVPLNVTSIGFKQYVAYKEKCETEKQYYIEHVRYFDTDKVVSRPYEGSRGLHKYFLRSEFFANMGPSHNGWAGIWNFGQVPYSSNYSPRTFEIKYGY